MGNSEQVTIPESGEGRVRENRLEERRGESERLKYAFESIALEDIWPWNCGRHVRSEERNPTVAEGQSG